MKGGPARAKKLTPEARTDQARRAVLARWRRAKGESPEGEGKESKYRFRRCPACGRPGVSESAIACPGCGYVLIPAEIPCPKCGTVLNLSAGLRTASKPVFSK